MYFTLAIDPLTKLANERQQIADLIKNTISHLAWVRPLANFYVVRCNDESVRTYVLRALADYTRQHPGTLRFIISPLSVGRVAGATAQSLWPHLNKITQEESSGFIHPDFAA